MNRRKDLQRKAVAAVMTASMVTSLCPPTVFAAQGEQVAKDGIYTKTVHVTNNSEDEDEWNEYDVTVDLEVKGGQFSNITVIPSNGYDEAESKSYFNKAVSKSKGFQTLLLNQAATEQMIDNWDTVSGATCTSTAIKQAALEAIREADVNVAVDTTALENIIAQAKELQENDYTTDSWNVVVSALAKAETALETKESQEAITEAANELTDAINALQKKPNESGYVYGTVNLPYADFYYGELNQVEASDKMDLEVEDKVSKAGYREAGMYDAVSSATTTKSKNFGATYYTETETGVNIEGLKDVNIAVPTSLYEEAKQAIAENKTCNNKLLEIIGAMTVSETTPVEYKVLNGDGTLGAMVTETVTDDAAATEIETNTTWGQYQISVESELLPDKSEMEGVIIETSDGRKYGMEHLENLWLRTGEFAFAVKDGFKVPQGNAIDYKRHEDLQGKTITKITYMIKDKADLVINTNLLCKKLLDEGYGVTGENTAYENGASIQMTVKAPKEANYQLASVTFGGKTLTAGTDYKYENNTLTVYKTENTGIGQYTLTYTDAAYEDITANIIFTAGYEEGSVKIENNQLVLPEGLDMATYLKSISAISVNGTALRGNNLGTTVFNADGSVNFAAEITSRGQTTVVFPDENAEYTLDVTSIGYPSVSGKVSSSETSGEEYKYVYAGLTWAEYWSSEGVYLAEDSSWNSSSSKQDTKGELDKGAFDAVTRATTNHGLHRGSYQCEAVIYDTDGKIYEISYWTSANDAVLVDGSVIQFNKGTITYTENGAEKTATMDHYEVNGMKYIPVKVKAEDYEAFCQKYHVTENSETVTGGYSENKLSAYTATAEVTEKTNGIKTAVKNEDGTFYFEARVTGSDSGLKDTALKTATGIEAAVKDAMGSYGEFLRVDLNGDYGDLAANMYAVRWTYYGNDSTYSKPLTSYGTKFAADNWMHKSNGIQLGLTESLRCQLPDGTDGTGYWALTVYAMGYEDYTYQFQATADHIVEPEESEYVYGTVNLPYADFYYGELNQVEASDKMDLEVEDKVSKAGYREAGMYDAVSSATTTKSKNFGATYYTETETGVNIEGLKDVNIAVPTSLYEEAKQAIAENKTCNNKLLEIIGAMTVSETTPVEYKVLNGDGTLGAMVTETVTDDAAATEIETNTTWGQYQISVESELLPDKSEMEGVIIETSDGRKYGMEHLENLWLRTGEFAFAVKDGFKVPQGNAIDYKRHEDLQGKTITKITYMIKDKADLVINTNLLCKKLLDEGYGVTGENTAYENGASIQMTVKAPKEANYQLASVTFGGKTLTAGTDYKYENNTLTVYKTENTGIGQYTLTYTDAAYEDITANIIFTAGYEEGSVKIENNQLVLPEGLDMATYLKSISAISVNGTALRGNNLGTTVFNADGSVNFAAEITSRGQTTVVFPDENAEYTLDVTSIGYPSVTGTVINRVSEVPSVTYRTHVQNEGWQTYVSDGVMSGTKGKSLRLEGIDIRLDNNSLGGSIEYRTHVQNEGWQAYVSDGAMSGTKGKSLRLEAIQIRLTGEIAEKYDVYYRTHIQDLGWLGWAKNDGKSGSAGLSKRLEGIEIRLVEKGGEAPGTTENAYMTNKNHTAEPEPDPLALPG